MTGDEPIEDFLARTNAQAAQVDGAIVALAQRVGTYRVALFQAGISDDFLEELVGEFHSMLLSHMFAPDDSGD